MSDEQIVQIDGAPVVAANVTIREYHLLWVSPRPPDSTRGWVIDLVDREKWPKTAAEGTAALAKLDALLHDILVRYLPDASSDMREVVADADLRYLLTVPGATDLLYTILKHPEVAEMLREHGFVMLDHGKATR
jgi:hypothetical protein